MNQWKTSPNDTFKKVFNMQHTYMLRFEEEWTIPF